MEHVAAPLRLLWSAEGPQAGRDDLLCDSVEAGVELGPASAVSLTQRGFLAILFSFKSQALYNLLQVVFG
jgi:hypothetical protein